MLPSKDFFKKIWRYSHLYLAVSSALFLLLATITGIILAFEPIQKQLNYSQKTSLENTTLAEILPKLELEYDEVFELKRNEDDLISVSALSMVHDVDGEFLIDISNGKPVAEIPKQSAFFEFVTSLHRSLFLKSTGRWIIGLNSVFLFLIVFSGIVLIAKRQNGWKNFFSKIIRLDFPSFSHTFLGRWILFPLLIVSLSAIILFLIRFEYLSLTETNQQEFSVNQTLENKKVSEFDVFNKYSLAEIKALEFPFMEDEEEYFILTTNVEKLHIHQFTGQIIRAENLATNDILYDWNLFLHTGKGSIFWSIILALSGISILYFIISGTQMALPRFKRKIKNKYTAKDAEIVILYGSESGSTQHFATLFFKSVLNTGKKVFFTTLNDYQDFPELKTLVIFTATYGRGEAPHNAQHFIEKFKKNPINKNVNFSIVGFGSSQYPDFCQFAIDIETLFSQYENLSSVTPITLIDNQSSNAFKNWWNTWNTNVNFKTVIPENIEKKKPKLNSFTVISKETYKDEFGETFTLILQPKNKNILFQSGDLLGIFPPNEKVERLYSIGKTKKGAILLAIKLHEKGLCSNYLNSINIGKKVKGFIKQNTHFHLNTSAKSVTFIANGTGIAPFLGIINAENSQENYLYWGGRTKASWQLYQNYIAENYLTELKFSFSRDDSEFNYLQDVVENEKANIIERLNNGGSLMICGSMHMQEDVLAILNQYAKENDFPSCEEWMAKGSIQFDTY